MCALLAVGALAQTAPVVAPVPTVPTFTLPTYVALGAAFNQIGTPRFNMFASAIVPVSSQAGVYESTTADIIPMTKVDPVTKRTVYTFQSTIREGAHKTIYTNQKFQLLLGGDAGAAFSQPSAGGVTVSLATSVTATAVYQIKPHWAVMVPIRGIWTAAIGWNLIPEAAVVWKP
jgi:hypothetical protein